VGAEVLQAVKEVEVVVVGYRFGLDIEEDWYVAVDTRFSGGIK